MEGYFIVLIVIGEKEQAQIEPFMPSFSAYIQKLFIETQSSPAGKWLMIEIKDKEVLADAEKLIRIRVKPKSPDT